MAIKSRGLGIGREPWEERLLLAIDSAVPYIEVLTDEWEGILPTLLSEAEKVKKTGEKWEIYTWDLATGLSEAVDPMTTDTELSMGINTAIGRGGPNQDSGVNLLRYFSTTLTSTQPLDGDNSRRVVVLPGVLSYIAQSPEGAMLAWLDKLSYFLPERATTLIFPSLSHCVPSQLSRKFDVIKMPLPSKNELGKILDSVMKDLTKSGFKETAKKAAEDRERIIDSVSGMTRFECRCGLYKSLSESGCKKIDPPFLQLLKRSQLFQDGILELVENPETMNEVGGFDLYKQYIARKQGYFTLKAKKFGVPPPKGTLIVGVQGCGKSLVAEATAAALGLTIVSLDISKVFQSRVGQSEEMMRRALNRLDALAPCCCRLEEMEKVLGGVISSAYTDSGVTARVVSIFLTWLQDRSSGVYIIANANSMKLPPELLRPGRLDGIWYVDLPTFDERKEIFRIHLAKRRTPEQEKLWNPGDFDLDKLAAITYTFNGRSYGYSGSEIEAAIVEAISVAFHGDGILSGDIIEQELRAITPIHKAMEKEIKRLREEMEQRQIRHVSSEAFHVIEEGKRAFTDSSELEIDQRI